MDVIATKWGFQNKMDDLGNITKNKTMLKAKILALRRRNNALLKHIYL